jgi:hypothetical protein
MACDIFSSAKEDITFALLLQCMHHGKCTTVPSVKVFHMNNAL